VAVSASAGAVGIVEAVPRIVSFLPAGTEIVHALGAGAELVGRSHECDYPPSVSHLPVVSRPALKLHDASPEDIDRAVAERMETGASMYEIDEVLLRELRPDVIITQNLCRVCAPSGNELSHAVKAFDVTPEILFLTPRNVAEVEENILAVGKAIGREREAESLVRSNRECIARVAAAVADVPRRRAVFLEWTDPLFCGGHWVPEMVAMAGGDDPLGRAGEDSVRIEWDEVAEAAPGAIIVSPCGYGLEESAELARSIPRELNARVYAVDANAYFARPGPRLAEGVELLAHIFHPNRVAWPHAHVPWKEISADSSARLH
jgi:iron complex transport system substrate-binding protein